MSLETEMTRDTALAILQAQGWSWERKGKGQRFVVHIKKGSESIPALVKTASRGSAMVRTDIDDADTARVSGFTDDVSHVFFAVGDPDRKEVSAYLVPLAEVDAAYRLTHKLWRSHHPNGDENLTWVIWFNDHGNADCNGFHRRWAHYRLGGSSVTTLAEDTRDLSLQASKGLTIAEAKQGLARSLGIDPSNIKIVIES